MDITFNNQQSNPLLGLCYCACCINAFAVVFLFLITLLCNRIIIFFYCSELLHHESLSEKLSNKTAFIWAVPKIMHIIYAGLYIENPGSFANRILYLPAVAHFLISSSRNTHNVIFFTSKVKGFILVLFCHYLFYLNLFLYLLFFSYFSSLQDAYKKALMVWKSSVYSHFLLTSSSCRCLSKTNIFLYTQHKEGVIATQSIT
jgi:hypothetical protein